MERLQVTKQKAIIFLSMACMMVWSLCMPMTARAAGGLNLSTDYPGIALKPGDTTTFDLYLTNAEETELDVTLSTAQIPEGWDGYFRGDSNQVSKVHVSANQKKENNADLSYSLSIPEEAEEGTYDVALKADAGSGNSYILNLEIEITTDEAGAGNFTAEYPEQQGATGTSFSFDTTLVNNGLTGASYSLAANAPEGWQVSFKPSGESTAVASLSVDSGSSQGITVAVTPSENVEKGDYTINCTAVSANETLNLDLTVTITGTYGVSLSTPTGNLSLSAYANEEAQATMSITNTGNVDLENLQLTSSASTDWNVRFDETTIDLLEAGATKEITAYIQPSEDAIIGDYLTEISISNDYASSVMDLRVSVKNHTTWGFVAVLIIVVLCGGLGLIIRKYGRR